MSYFEDLTPFRYSQTRWVDNPHTYVNIGWLGKTVPPPAFEIDDSTKKEVIAHLFKHTAFPVNKYMGHHICEICGLNNGGSNGEIFIEGEGDIIYVAPRLILHYFRDDNYVPPKEFIDAVLKSKEGCYDKYLKMHDDFFEKEHEIRMSEMRKGGKLKS